MDCQHEDRDPVYADGSRLVAQVCRGCGEEWPVDLEALASLPVPPAVEAEHHLRVRAFLDSLPDTSGVFRGELR